MRITESQLRRVVRKLVNEQVDGNLNVPVQKSSPRQPVMSGLDVPTGSVYGWDEVFAAVKETLDEGHITKSQYRNVINAMIRIKNVTDPLMDSGKRCTSQIFNMIDRFKKTYFYMYLPDKVVEWSKTASASLPLYYTSPDGEEIDWDDLAADLEDAALSSGFGAPVPSSETAALRRVKNAAEMLGYTDLPKDFLRTVALNLMDD